MNYKISLTDRQPAYMQLYRAIVKDILNGAYRFGSRLPSKRTIASETCVSVITAEHALALLCDEGYIEPRERSGYYVLYRAEDFPSVSPHYTPGPPAGNDPVPLPAAARNSHGPAPLTAARNGPGPAPLTAARNGSAFRNDQTPHQAGSFPFSAAAKAMRKVLADYGDRIMVRSPNGGCSELRQEIAAYLERSRGIAASPEQIIIGAGAEYLYSLAAQLLGYERKFALEDPSYEKIRKVYQALRIRYDLLPMTRDGISSEALSGTDASVLHVTPFNSFPSGVSIGITKKLEYLRWARNRNGFIIEDNYDSELTVSAKEEDSLFSITSGDNVIYLNTFTKTITPSIRAGYMVLPDTLAAEFSERLGFYSCTVPLFEQYVLAELLRNGEFERHISRVRRQKRRDAKSTLQQSSAAECLNK